MIYFSRPAFPIIEFEHSSILSFTFLIIGLFVLISAARAFRASKTTINPLKPEQATSLVTGDIFRFSRNPMYLGMAFILSSLAISFNLIGGVIFVALFCMYITIFQIIPEEVAMKKIFSQEFDTYMQSTRRWI
ncbi:MAG: isoprenylcysteine carboxylmethyltransferase family protein [SAR86 cluster bacterium]|nr:isoprenylcysteine carboxylmethyltransferase family protein [Gammaproteobacteria bacterium]MDG1203668.1 isoprenylcysteine carboxylmethyltransferase family protein [SAR86 cluster bacterium]